MFGILERKCVAIPPILPGLQVAPPHTHMWMGGNCGETSPRMVKELVAGYYKLRKQGVTDGESWSKTVRLIS